MYNMETKYESAMERNAYDPYSKATEKSWSAEPIPSPAESLKLLTYCELVNL